MTFSPSTMAEKKGLVYHCICHNLHVLLMKVRFTEVDIRGGSSGCNNMIAFRLSYIVQNEPGDVIVMKGIVMNGPAVNDNVDTVHIEEVPGFF